MRGGSVCGRRRGSARCRSTPRPRAATRILSLSEDLPVMIVIVDTPDAIEDFLTQIAPSLAQGLIVVEDVEVVRYVPAEEKLRR
ncbi:MAG TPA: DUF190 domain-containing protein [Pseudonocardiaceae bacterium]|nr:DUF190 domain-containing protein [Pseudonocardiaceae bacterium]